LAGVRHACARTSRWLRRIVRAGVTSLSAPNHVVGRHLLVSDWRLSMKKQVALYVSVAAIALACATAVSAHMKFEKAVPASGSTVSAPPSEVQVWFSEAPDAAVSKLTLTGPAGPIELTGLHVMDKMSLMAMVSHADKMSDGRYTVAWQSAGDDGHVQKGDFAFTLKRAK